MLRIRVREVMSTPAVCIDSQSDIPSAHLLMLETGVRRLPVLDDGELVGIITLGDVRGASPSEVSSLNRSELDYLTHQIRVQRIMSRDVVTVTPETSLADAAQLMIERRISGLPVVSEEGRIVGMITESDIFRTMIEMLQTATATEMAL